MGPHAGKSGRSGLAIDARPWDASHTRRPGATETVPRHMFSDQSASQSRRTCRRVVGNGIEQASLVLGVVEARPSSRAPTGLLHEPPRAVPAPTASIGGRYALHAISWESASSRRSRDRGVRHPLFHRACHEPSTITTAGVGRCFGGGRTCATLWWGHGVPRPRSRIGLAFGTNSRLVEFSGTVRDFTNATAPGNTPPVVPGTREGRAQLDRLVGGFPEQLPDSDQALAVSGPGAPPRR